MTWVEIERGWPQLVGQAKAKWPKLSDHDLATISGKRDRLIGKLEERYGLPSDLGEEHVDEWSAYEAKHAAEASGNGYG